MIGARETRRTRVWVEQIMGTAVSIHVVGPGADAPGIAEAIVRCCAQLRDIERVFSTFRDDSDISRIRRGELTVARADPRVATVEALCREAATQTDHRFSAWWRGWFDPTGLVKGWAVELAAARHLAPLIDRDEVDAVGINAGGDLRLFTASGSDWVWRVAVADPTAAGSVLATIEVRNGAVATSGTAARGAHIIDPRTGRPAVAVRSATVVADDLRVADVWATAAVVAGAGDLSWISHAPIASGMILDATGGVRRFVGGVEVTVTAAAA